jgi:drug/metabolite transporter (DMT)-like permease
MLLNAFLLIFAAAIWGMGFIASRWTLVDYSPMWSNSFRYFLAALMALPVLLYYKSYKRTRRELGITLIASLLLLAGMIFQVYGIKYTTVAKSGFLTTFYAFFVPVIGVFKHGKRFSGGYWALLLLAIFGVALLCDLKISSFNYGDFLILGCAFCFAAHIDYLGKYANLFSNGLEFNMLQCLFMGLIAYPLGLLIDGAFDWQPLLHTAKDWDGALSGFLILAFFSSLIAFSIQVHGQKTIPPHIAGLLFLLESPFAAVFGYIFLDEKLSTMNIWGCVVIVVAVALIPLVERPKTTI